MSLAEYALAGLLLSGSAKPKCEVSIDVYPKVVLVQPGGSSVRVRVRIKPDPSNVYLGFGWQQSYPGEGGSSGWSLDDESPKYFERTINHIVAPGTMAVRARLFQHDGKKDGYCQDEVRVEVR